MNPNKSVIRRLERIQAVTTSSADFEAVVDAMRCEFMTPRERRAFDMIVRVLALAEEMSWQEVRRCFRSDNACDSSGMPYEQYLKTEHWKLIRQQKLIQADYRCQICNSAHGPEVHHRTYERLGHEDLADLTVLCGDCHSKFHDKLPAQSEVPA